MADEQDIVVDPSSEAEESEQPVPGNEVEAQPLPDEETLTEVEANVEENSDMAEPIESGDAEGLNVLMEEGTNPRQPVAGTGMSEETTTFDVQPAMFPPLESSLEATMAAEDLDFLKDVDLDVTVELGRAEMSLHDVLGLTHGVVVELDKLAGEPVDILVNGKLVGRGEVVVIEAMFGVRVTDIIPPDQRWKYR